MPTSASCARSWILGVVAAVVWGTGLLAGFAHAPRAQSAEPPLGTEELIAKVGRRIAEFYKRAQSLVCLEKVTSQPVGSDRSPNGFGRVLEYELRIESDGTDGDAPT